MRVMLIDDDKEILKSLSDSLSLNGIYNTQFTSPVKAIKAYRSERFDVVITDLLMPEMNGLKVLQVLREYDSNACVIILTASNNIEHAVEALNNKAAAFILKPAGLDDLLSLLSEVKKEMKNTKEKADAINLLIAEYTKLKDAFSNVQKIIDNLSSESKKKMTPIIQIKTDPVSY
ncbi:response regulator [candidate division KSB1 bacterium]